MSLPPTLAPRFRSPAASTTSRHAAGAMILTAIGLLGLLGLTRALPVAFAFFAVGAGAGYSLSGSV